eukprot:4321802-Alexandrium_andersonii.AAC.1
MCIRDRHGFRPRRPPHPANNPACDTPGSSAQCRLPLPPRGAGWRDRQSMRPRLNEHGFGRFAGPPPVPQGYLDVRELRQCS